jgi:hypothetical protein
MRRLAVLALAVVGLAACLPTTGGRHVYGDSLSAQVMSHGVHRGDGFTWHAGSGATLADHADAILRQKPAIVVLALGSNEVLRGWDGGDEAVWSWVVMALPARTDVRIVLPWFHITDTTELDQARAYLSALPRVDHVIDWRDSFLAAWTVDGIHVTTVVGIQTRHDITVGLP